MADKIKLLIAGLLVITAVVLFYVYSDQSLLFRVLGLLIAAGIAVAIASRTEVGVNTIGFGRGAMVEVRKVVWPTRKETVQTTLMVMAMVVVVGLILWAFDTFLGWGVRLLTGQGG